ncbi:MAG: aspartate/glutamate racemase family protein [Loktanella sp.]|nr:aspartate/glutamate racemase family protein [Loktanella sp.]
MRAKAWFDPVTVILINPNSTQAMTQSALRAAQEAAPDIRFEGWTSTLGPAAIEGPDDGAEAIPPLLDLVRKASATGPDVIIIACFDDTGLQEAQSIAACPVIGIGQASYVLASLMPGPTAVITTVAAAVPVITANIRSHSFGANISHIVAANVPVLMLTNDPTTALQKFIGAAQQLPDGTRNVILGCSGVVSIKQHFAQDLALNVIDGVSAAAQLCKALATN